MKIPVGKQIDFLNWQLQENEDLFTAYLNKPMNAHFANRSASIGKIWGVDEKRGNLIIRFEPGMSPRLNMPLSGLLFKGIPTVEDLKTWNFSYKFFRQNYAAATTDILPIYFMNSEKKDYNLVGCRDVETSFLNLFQNHLKNGKHPSIVLAERDPPVQYLINLKSFIKFNPDDDVLNSSIDKTLESWKPERFLDQIQKKEKILSTLKTHPEVIIQGPPGTGKSYLIAELAQLFLGEGKSVCITALTNKALMEIAEKPGIKNCASEGRVYKTNLTFSEFYLNQKLKTAESLSIGKNELLLATYYKLSDWYSPSSGESIALSTPVYDVIIIEEASQCFLATIAAFKRLGRTVLIIGDPMQLPPIVLNKNKAKSVHPHVMKFANGLETYAANSGVKSYLLNQTYRLSLKAAKQTGIFYKNQLESIQDEFKPVNLSDAFRTLTPTHGETKIKFIPLITEGDKPLKAISFAVDLLIHLTKHNPGLKVAILAPFKNTVLSLQEKVGKYFHDQSDITIETIDRVQGLTVDFTIYLLALNNPNFAMNLNRFNVATSRSKRGTIIITDHKYLSFKGIDPLVTKFLNSLEVVD